VEDAEGAGGVVRGVLDAAADALAREQDWSSAAAKQGGLKTVEREFQWSLSWR